MFLEFYVIKLQFGEFQIFSPFLEVLELIRANLNHPLPLFEFLCYSSMAIPLLLGVNWAEKGGRLEPQPPSPYLGLYTTKTSSPVAASSISEPSRLDFF